MHGTYDGYVRGCRKPCCNCPDNRELFAKNYPHGIPKQNKKAIPTDERTSNDDTDPTDDTTD